MKKLLKTLCGGVLLALSCAASAQNADTVQFVFTSDAHYGYTRADFRGEKKVDAQKVNQAMIAKMNTIQTLTLPDDSGVNGGKAVGPVDFIVEGGDIANREEGTQDSSIQCATDSWKQFTGDYLGMLALTDAAGNKAPVYMIPGNHDVTNAIGFYKPMYPAKDAGSMAGIYNLMMKPATPVTADTYDYSKDRISYSFDKGGVHFVFITMWPDSVNRAWIEKDLKKSSSVTPVILFCHDQPDIEAKHLRNPNGSHDINKTDKFENMVADQMADGKTISASSTLEQAALEKFLSAHKNIVAYFHGNDHINRVYEWVGPDRKVTLHTVGSDSPMKGSVSAKDETKLGFDLVTIDAKNKMLTVRSAYWNADPADPSAPVVWNIPSSFSLLPRK